MINQTIVTDLKVHMDQEKNYLVRIKVHENSTKLKL